MAQTASSNENIPISKQDASPFKTPTAPTMALNPLSPSHIHNTSRPSDRSVPNSPSSKTEVIPGFHKHHRTSSDVQGMVARFNSLDIKDHDEMRRRDQAALRRAQMGREEAEAELKKHREEIRRLKEEQKDAGERERKVMKRMDNLMEELHKAKETMSTHQEAYVKEIKKTRREAFKTSSALVKLQEELQSTRKVLKVSQMDLQTERSKSESQTQDVFTAQYELVGMQEKLTQALAQMKIVEEERDALKTSLKEEEVARIAAQGQIALPTSRDDDSEFGSPRKSPLPQPRPREPSKSREVDDLRRQVEHERRQRVLAEEQVDFMKMECQFQCCSCRVAESSAPHYTHDESVIKAIASVRAIVDSPMEDAPEQINTPIHTAVEQPHPASLREDAPRSRSATPKSATASEADISFCSHTGTFRSRQPPTQPAHPSPSDPHATYTTVHPAPPRHSRSRTPIPATASTPAPPAPSTPSHVAIRTITTTTSVPLVDPKSPGYAAFFAPGTAISREEAMARIRERRGRARSVTGTPARRARAASLTPGRREVSEGSGATPKSAAPRVGRA